jgi:hypothetical protein
MMPIFAAGTLLTVGPVLSAQSQSNAATTEAKQHYQNAVAALEPRI